MSDPTRMSQVLLLIRVLDVNDNRPEFEQPLYNASISETADLGTTLIQVAAFDDDIVSVSITRILLLCVMICLFITQNENAFFLYDLRNVDPSFVGILPFNISSNGVISVAMSLDYESINSYKFEVCYAL